MFFVRYTNHILTVIALRKATQTKENTMQLKPYALGLSVAILLAVASAPAMAQKKTTRTAALKKCIAVMTQYVKFDGKAESAQDNYAGQATERYNNLFANCMKDHGQTP